MKDYLNLFWLIPGLPFLFHLLIVLMMAAAPRPLGSIATQFYEPMFFITPAIGVIVLLILLGLLIVDRPTLKRISFARTLTFSLLDLIAPILFLFMGIILSGFTR